MRGLRSERSDLVVSGGVQVNTSNDLSTWPLSQDPLIKEECF